MTTDSTKQNPTAEVEPSDVTELSEETLEGLDGGVVDTVKFNPIIRALRKKRKEIPNELDEPKDGGATGSW